MRAEVVDGRVFPLFEKDGNHQSFHMKSPTFSFGDRTGFCNGMISGHETFFLRYLIRNELTGLLRLLEGEL